jgi:glycosyltransferase involved in cell wall biosynthesis
MRLGIAIPCYKYHLSALKRCLDSIEAQTRKPDEVVVGCSSVEAEDIPVYTYSFPLRILTRPGRHNAAENRNYAETALTTDIVSFFDADDVMHPQRIEAIQSAFELYPQCDILLHSYLTEQETMQPFATYTIFDIRLNTLCRGTHGYGAIHKNKSTEHIHHSQISVNKSVLSRVKFNEAKDHERKEDSIFCGDILALRNPECMNIYIGNALSKYYKEGQTY